MFNDKAQIYTLEGAAAATIMLLVIIFTIDSTSMTPLTSSTANVHVETELQVLGQDILNSLDYSDLGYNSDLKTDILKWNGIEHIWNGSRYQSKIGTYVLNNNITEILNATLIGQGIAHNVEITYLNNNTLEPETLNMIYDGTPSENAIIISRKIVIQNSDNPEIYPITDIDKSTNLYNIVDVKLILWRM